MEGSTLEPTSASGVPPLADVPTDQPVAAAITSRAKIVRALDQSLSEGSGSLNRRMTVGYAGVEATSVDHLEWVGQAGLATSRMEIDEKYLATREIRDLLDSMNRDRALHDIELDAEQLRAAFDEIRQSAAAMLDSVESDGVEMEPIGLGWWEGSLEGIGDTEQLDVLVKNGRVFTIVFTIEVIGSTGTDTWEFLG